LSTVVYFEKVHIPAIAEILSDTGIKPTPEALAKEAFSCINVEEGNITAASVGAAEIYAAAMQYTVATGSWTETMNIEVDMSLSSESVKANAKGFLSSSIKIENYREDNISNLRLSGDVNMRVAGQECAWTMQYQNGLIHYDYTKPEIKSADVEIDPQYFEFSAFTQDMLISAEVIQNQIFFTVPGEQMASVASEAIGMINGIRELQYGDAEVAVTINRITGCIDVISMKFPASMTYQGFDAKGNYKVEYHFTK